MNLLQAQCRINTNKKNYALPIFLGKFQLSHCPCSALLACLVLGSGFLVRLISPTISYSKPSPPIKPVRRKLSNPQQQDYVPLNRPHSPSGQDRPPSSAFLNRLAETMRDKRSQLEVRKDEFMSETLPEWKVRSADFSSMAKETGMEWSKRGRTAVDRWKKDRMSMFCSFFSCCEAVKTVLVVIIKNVVYSIVSFHSC